MGQALMTIQQIKKRYGHNQVLNGVDLDIQDGEVIVIIGPSGSGKTTLLRSLNGLNPADSGQLRIGDVKIDMTTVKPKAMLAYQRQTGMVFQNYALFANKTAKENIMMPLRLTQKLAKQEAEQVAEQLLHEVGLAERGDFYPSQLSGGQQQRIGIARMLALKPKVMLFDEPTSALDPELVQQTLALLQKIANAGATMILVTHEMQFAEQVADRVVFMAGGRVVEQGTPTQIFKHPVNPRTREFLARFTKKAVMV